MGCPLEYFHVGFRPAFAERWDAHDLSGYVAKLHRFRTDPTGVFSVKLFWRDLADLADEIAPGAFPGLRATPPGQTPPETYRRLRALLEPILPGATWILLDRGDALRQAVSNYVAYRTGNWRSLPEETALPAEAPDYDPAIIRRFVGRILTHNAHWRNFMRANAIDAHAVRYEALELDYAGTLRTLFDELCRPHPDLPAPRLRKQADGLTEALLARFRDDMKTGA